jgi:hypothetical protein
MSPDRFDRWKARAVVWVAGFALLTPGLGSARSLTYHEVCFAQPAREMLATGRWIVPEIAGVVFPDKPPLAHWTAAASMALLGENEFAVRLPFALAGIFLAAIIAELAMAFRGPFVGAIAGLIQLTSYYTLMQARLAECDILLALAVTAAISAFAFVELRAIFSNSRLSLRGSSANGLRPPMDGALSRSERRLSFTETPASLRSVLFVHFCAAAAFLAKGPLGLFFVCAPMLAFLLVERRCRDILHWLHPAGLCVSLAAVIGWPLAALWSHPEILEGWKRHNLDRFSGTLEADATWPIYYLGMIPLLLLPWSPWLFYGWWRSDDAAATKSLKRFTLCWVLPGLLVISAASWRHKHYAIPLLPILSLWSAVGLVLWIENRGHRASLLGLESEGHSAGPPPAAPRRPPPAAGRGVFLPRLAYLFLVVGAVESIALRWIVPSFDSYRQQATFARRIAERIGAEPLHVPYIPTGHGAPLALPENQIAFYLPLHLRVMNDPAQADWVLAPARMSVELQGFEAVDRVDKLRRLMGEGDRLTLFRKTTAIADRDSELRR